MRFTIRFLAAAGLAVAAVPAGADPDAGVGQDAFVGLRWNEAPHTGALGSAAAAQTGSPSPTMRSLACAGTRRPIPGSWQSPNRGSPSPPTRSSAPAGVMPPPPKPSRRLRRRRPRPALGRPRAPALAWLAPGDARRRAGRNGSMAVPPRSVRLQAAPCSSGGVPDPGPARRSAASGVRPPGGSRRRGACPTSKPTCPQSAHGADAHARDELVKAPARFACGLPRPGPPRPPGSRNLARSVSRDGAALARPPWEADRDVPPPCEERPPAAGDLDRRRPRSRPRAF